MNGIHDMGGMQDMGPIVIEKNEPVFHQPWEGRVFALTSAARAGQSNLDNQRFEIEKLPPVDYLSLSYYEKWMARLEAHLISQGLVTREEIENGKATPGVPKPTPARSPGGGFHRSAGSAARFKVNQRVRTRNMNPNGHTRLPRYARAKTGVIIRDHGIFVFPDTNAEFLGEKPQHVYSVRFTARELWGEQESRDAVFLDLWDNYLEHA